MEYRVKVIANSKKESVIPLRDGRYEVRVDAPRKDGRANERSCALLAAFLGVSEESVTIIRGHTQSTKVCFVRGEAE